MAVPVHRLTGAQVCAGDTLQPALIWTSDPTGDWLASNGVPGWYDPDGTDHQATARTWYHTPTGVRGSPRPTGPRRRVPPADPVAAENAVRPAHAGRGHDDRERFGLSPARSTPVTTR
jgi:hypothetical protein